MPAPIIPASDAEIPVLLDRLMEINTQMKALKTEADQIEARLTEAARTMDHEPLEDSTREGRQVKLRSQRYELPILFTADSLIKSFRADSPQHRKLLFVLAGTASPSPEQLDAAKTSLALFFSPPSAWETRFKDGQEFRKKAAELLSEERAPKFIAACRQTNKDGIPQNKTVVNVDGVKEVVK